MIQNIFTEKETDCLLVISQADAIVETICNNELAFEELDIAIRNLENLIFDLDEADEALVNQYFEGLSKSKRKVVTDAYCRWETIHENSFAESLLNGTVQSPKDYLLYERFCHLISKELELVKGFGYQSLLFIGSGPFPITAILCHEFTNLVVDCLEKDEQAAVVSRKVLQTLGLENKVRVHVGDGGSFDLSRYDVIINALLAKPKWTIMKNIRNSNVNAKVLCRTSFGLRQLIYEGTPDNALNGFKEMGKQQATYNDTISTLLCINKKEISNKVKFKWVNLLNPEEKSKVINMMNAIIATDNNNGFTSLMNSNHVYFDILGRDLEIGLKHLLMIEGEDKYLGQLIINISYVDTYRHRAEISTLMLDESIRGKEVSIEVVHQLLQKCEALGIQYLTLTARSGSKVELLWKFLGFETFGKLPCYSRVDSRQYEGVYMFKDVEALKTSLIRKLENLYI